MYILIICLMNSDSFYDLDPDFTHFKLSRMEATHL